jgi:hypothetical protein
MKHVGDAAKLREMATSNLGERGDEVAHRKMRDVGSARA